MASVVNCGYARPHPQYARTAIRELICLKNSHAHDTIAGQDLTSILSYVYKQNKTDRRTEGLQHGQLQERANKTKLTDAQKACSMDNSKNGQTCILCVVKAWVRH